MRRTIEACIGWNEARFNGSHTGERAGAEVVGWRSYKLMAVLANLPGWASTSRLDLKLSGLGRFAPVHQSSQRYSFATDGAAWNWSSARTPKSTSAGWRNVAATGLSSSGRHTSRLALPKWLRSGSGRSHGIALGGSRCGASVNGSGELRGITSQTSGIAWRSGSEWRTRYPPRARIKRTLYSKKLPLASVELRPISLQSQPCRHYVGSAALVFWGQGARHKCP